MWFAFRFKKHNILTIMSKICKLLVMTNFREGERCWLCDGPDSAWSSMLAPTDDILSQPRYRAVMQAIQTLMNKALNKSRGGSNFEGIKQIIMILIEIPPFTLLFFWGHKLVNDTKC